MLEAEDEIGVFAGEGERLVGGGRVDPNDHLIGDVVELLQQPLQPRP